MERGAGTIGNGKENPAHPLRFKFMPTPSGRLHVGHAWLLLVTDALMRAAQRVGSAVELIVVFDTRVSRHYGRSDRVIETICGEILADIARLGIAPSRVLSNEEVRWDTDREALATQIGEPFGSQALRPPSFFLDNARLDQELGVTHIVRGSDRRSYQTVYERCYTAQGCAGPTQVFLPLVRDTDGAKITARTPYSVDELLDSMTPEQLFCMLVDTCIESDSQGSVSGDCARATTRLLKDDWRFVLGGDVQQLVKAFEARFVDVPRLKIPEQSCKPAA